MGVEMMPGLMHRVRPATHGVAACSTRSWLIAWRAASRPEVVEIDGLA
jgi:hypothetical protein